MDQSVSPAVTTCVAGSCPCSPDTAAGAAWEVSGARCEVSGRAWVVSCAASTGAFPSAAATATAAPRRQEQHLPCDDLGGVARFLLAVLSVAVIDLSLDVD